MLNLNETVSLYIHSFYTFHPEKPILIGFSGGADSLCLLHILKQTFPHIVIAHFNHQLRSESITEENYAAQVAKDLGLPIIIGSEDVITYAKSEKRGIEEAARMLRYRFLFYQAHSINAQAVAVGHHADDQVESVLLHFLRGAGISGLKGMLPYKLPNAWDENIPLLRPLLNTWKKEILDYCHQQRLFPLYDNSNDDTTYLRNRLRHEFIPYVQEQYNPNFKQMVWQTANTIAADDEFLEQETKKAWQGCVIHSDKFCIVLSPQLTIQLPLAIKRLLFRQVIKALLPDFRDIDYYTTQKAIGFLHSSMQEKPPKSRSSHLMRGMNIYFESKLKQEKGEPPFILTIVHQTQSERDGLCNVLPEHSLYPHAPKTPLDITIPNQIILNGWEITCKVIAINKSLSDIENIQHNQNGYTAWLDIDQFAQENDRFILRKRQAGDRFQPLGVEKGSMKLSDYMINVKIPRRFRDDWLLICYQEQILWLPGFQIAHPQRITSTTKKALHISLSKVKQMG